MVFLQITMFHEVAHAVGCKKFTIDGKANGKRALKGKYSPSLEEGKA